MKFNLLFKRNFPVGRIKEMYTYPGGHVESHADEGVKKLLHQIQWIVRIYENDGYTD